MKQQHHHQSTSAQLIHRYINAWSVQRTVIIMDHLCNVFALVVAAHRKRPNSTIELINTLTARIHTPFGRRSLLYACVVLPLGLSCLLLVVTRITSHRWKLSRAVCGILCWRFCWCLSWLFCGLPCGGVFTNSVLYSSTSTRFLHSTGTCATLGAHSRTTKTTTSPVMSCTGAS